MLGQKRHPVHALNPDKGIPKILVHKKITTRTFAVNSPVNEDNLKMPGPVR